MMQRASTTVEKSAIRLAGQIRIEASTSGLRKSCRHEQRSARTCHDVATKGL